MDCWSFNTVSTVWLSSYLPKVTAQCFLLSPALRYYQVLLLWFLVVLPRHIVPQQVPLQVISDVLALSVAACLWWAELCLKSRTQCRWDRAQAHIAANTAVKAIPSLNEPQTAKCYVFWTVNEKKWIRTLFSNVYFQCKWEKCKRIRHISAVLSWLHAESLPGEGKLKWRSLSLCAFLHLNVCKWSRSSAEQAQPSVPSRADSLGLTSWPWELFRHLVSLIWLIIFLIILLPFQLLPPHPHTLTPLQPHPPFASGWIPYWVPVVDQSSKQVKILFLIHFYISY